jgi:hypothetical protein
MGFHRALKGSGFSRSLRFCVSEVDRRRAGGTKMFLRAVTGIRTPDPRGLRVGRPLFSRAPAHRGAIRPDKLIAFIIARLREVILPSMG